MPHYKFKFGVMNLKKKPKNLKSEAEAQAYGILKAPPYEATILIEPGATFKKKYKFKSFRKTFRDFTFTQSTIDFYIL